MTHCDKLVTKAICASEHNQVTSDIIVTDRLILLVPTSRSPSPVSVVVLVPSVLASDFTGFAGFPHT
jgi:hypothetical protein